MLALYKGSTVVNIYFFGSETPLSLKLRILPLSYRSEF